MIVINKKKTKIIIYIRDSLLTRNRVLEVKVKLTIQADKGIKK